MSKAQETAAAGLLRGIAYGKEQAKADRRLAAEAKLERVLDLVDIGAIRPRPGGDTRPAGAEHVLELSETVAAVGLLQPPAIDSLRHLLAGLHRLEACRLLLTPREGRMDRLLALDGGDKLDPEETAGRLAVLPAPQDLEGPLGAGKIPCRVVVDLDAERDPGAALAVEAAENTARKNYTAPEVQALAQRLRAAGYRETGGRPRRGEKALRPALEMVLGVHASTIRRLLGKKDAAAKGGQVATFSDLLAHLRRAVHKAYEACPEFSMANKDIPKFKKLKKARPALFAVMYALETLDTNLDAALADAKALEDGKE